jgi:penicillin-binding protein 1A
MGITTPISTNPAMTIGGLSIGVTPLDMAHAYETIAHGGQRVSGTLAEDDAPVGIQEVVSPSSPLPDGSHRDVNQVRTKPVLPAGVAATETEMLETVLQYGTAKVAALDEFAAGKTGTTSNYVDAWFVGWNHKYTVAVWVGYPEGAKPMLTDYDGGPVLGGTFPALIWHNFMTSALGIEKERAEHAAGSKHGAGAGSGSQSGTGSTTESTTPSSTGATPGQTTAPTTGGGSGAGKEGTGKSATPGGGSEAGTGTGTGTPKAGAEPEHTAAPAPATPTPEAPSTPATPSAPAPSTPGAGGIPNSPSSPSPTGGVSAGG